MKVFKALLGIVCGTVLFSCTAPVQQEEKAEEVKVEQPKKEEPPKPIKEEPKNPNDIDYTNPTVITNWIKEQDFTLIIKFKMRQYIQNNYLSMLLNHIATVQSLYHHNN